MTTDLDKELVEINFVRSLVRECLILNKLSPDMVSAVMLDMSIEYMKDAGFSKLECANEILKYINVIYD